MANKVQEQTDVMVEAKGKLELFFDKWGNKILWVLVAVAIVVGAYFIYKNYAASKHEAMSLEASAALNAAETIEDYAAIATKYEGTEAANTALYSAGALALDAGDLAAAKSYLAKYQNAEGPAGEILNASVYGLRGDIAVEENDLQSAASLFRQASEASHDELTYARFMDKLARVYEAMGDDAKAQQCYKDVVAKYPQYASFYENRIRE